jgi:template-activating factor I
MRAAVHHLVSSLFSPPKRAREDSDSESSFRRNRRKKIRRSSSVSSSDIPSYLEALERLQSRLLELDEECTQEQIEIQKKFDAQKRPVWDKRKSVIEQIPDFWATAIAHHPLTMHEKIFWKQDFPILSLLTHIDLIDNKDKFGSYDLIFTFNSENNIYFPETEIVRKLIVSSGNHEHVSVTPITWAPGKKPKSKKSFFYWLCSSEVKNDDGVDVGEIFRTDLWQNPYPYFLNLSPDEIAAASEANQSGTTEIVFEENSAFSDNTSN